MKFSRIEPPSSIDRFIDCYWIIEDDNTEIVKQKIIPDGYPEIIFQFGDPYRILLKNEWETQAKFLLAGQLSKYFFLENTGRTGTFGIKLKPAAASQLFGFNMKDFVDKVIDLDKIQNKELKAIKKILASNTYHDETISRLSEFFMELINKNPVNGLPIDHALNLVFEKHGMVTIAELSAVAKLGERQLLNQFRKYVGLSPKLYARIIRLNHIFKLVEKNNENWTSLAYEAAFFDQAHFIKDFKSFIGEKPSKYNFDEKNMANFFLVPQNKNVR